MTHEDYMKAAIEQAKIAKNNGDLPFGAVVVCNNKIVGQGYASDKTTGDITDHAELAAIRKAAKNLGRNNLSDCTIYCTNEPCIMCSAGIFQSKISQIFVGASRDDLKNILRLRKLRIEDLANDSGYKINITKGILKDEVLHLFNS